MSDYGDDFDESPRGHTSGSSRRVNASAAPVRASSSGAAVRPHLAVLPSSTAKLTPEQEATVADLKKTNNKLRLEVLELNKQLDECLAQKGQRLTRIAPLQRTNSASLCDQVMHKNERLRKTNHELTSKLHQADGLDRISELRNGIGHSSAEAEVLRGENRSLENVFAHQMVSLRVVQRIEDELAKERSEHLDFVRTLKDQTRSARETRDAEMSMFRDLNRQIDRLEEKIRIQSDVGDSVRTVDDLRQQVEAKDRMIDALKYQVTVLSRTNTSDQKRARVVAAKVGSELAALRAEADDLRQRLTTAGVAADFNVDTRI